MQLYIFQLHTTYINMQLFITIQNKLKPTKPTIPIINDFDINYCKNMKKLIVLKF